MKFFQRLWRKLFPKKKIDHATEEVRYGFAVLMVVRTSTPMPKSVVEGCLDKAMRQLEAIRLVSDDPRVNHPITAWVTRNGYLLTTLDDTHIPLTISPQALNALKQHAKEALDTPPI